MSAAAIEVCACVSTWMSVLMHVWKKCTNMFGCLSVCLFAVSFLVNDSVLFIRHFNTFDANAGVGSGQAACSDIDTTSLTPTQTHIHTQTQTHAETHRIHRNRIYFYLMRASHMRMLAVPMLVWMNMYVHVCVCTYICVRVCVACTAYQDWIRIFVDCFDYCTPK